MSTLSLRKIKHDSSSVDNITLNSNGTTTANAEVIVPSLKGSAGNKLQLRSGDSSYGVSLQNISGIDLFSIDAVGRITTPYQPAFRATGDNTSQSLTNAVATVVIFKVAETNRGNCYNTTNGRFTAPIAGFYAFTSSILVTQNAANRIDLCFYKNGGVWISNEFRDGGAVSTNAAVEATAYGYLNAGDFVEVITAVHGANGSIYQEPKFWNFGGYLIG